MKILGLYDGSGPKYHRILFPCSGLTHEHGIDCKIVSHIIEEDLPGVDIVFFNRLARTTHETILHWKGKYGFKLVCDLDDHWILDKGHQLYDQYKEHNVSKNIQWHIKTSDAVFVTHDRLAAEVLPLNKNVYILPNAIPQHDQFLIKKIPDEKIRLFWAGSSTHKRDIELLRRPLQLIKRDSVKFIMGGYDEKSEDLKEMAKMFTCNSSYNTQVIKSMPVEKYYEIYALCDISLIPLVDVEFNRYKSNLKVLEAANVEAPVIVSRVHPYLDFPEDIVNYVDAYNPWYSQINKLLKEPNLRRDQGLELKAYCNLHYNFEKINEQRKQILEHEASKQGKAGEVQVRA